MNYIKLLNKLRKSVLISPGFITVEYFRKDFMSVWIWIHILESYFNNKNINIQRIMQKIPYEYASRPTIYKIIDAAVAKKYFIKIKDEKDKRKYNLFPSIQVINEFKEWAKLFKGF
tara:strand:+ start:283 stop:630 length:348 start_codon:yes stop_codon:yes gene_type:complete